jgi:Zn-dependent protease
MPISTTIIRRDTQLADRSLLRKLGPAFIIAMKSSKLVALFKVLKFTKPLITAASMLLSTILYGLAYGWLFGVGIIVILFIHEMGHVVALRHKGFATSGPVFIPFLGAAIFLPQQLDRDTEAFVGIGGPVVGTAFAIICLVFWFLTGNVLALLLSYLGLFLNLFNLIPITPLDGGRVTQAIGPWFFYLGVIILTGLLFVTLQPIWFFIAVISLSDMKLRRWWRPTIAILLETIMVVLIFFGYSDQSTWIDSIDITIISILCGLYLYSDITNLPRFDDTTQIDRPVLPQVYRWKWFFTYACLLCVAGAAVLYEIPFLPHK